MQPAATIHPLLKMAALAGVESAIRAQIAKGVDVNATDGSGRSALLLAVSRGHLAACALLLAAGANPCARDAQGRDALELATAIGRTDIVTLLRASLPQLDSVGSTTYAAGATLNDDDDDEPPDDGLEGAEWEPDLPFVLPDSDEDCEARAASLQARMSRHTSVTLGADWSDLPLELPDVDDDPATPEIRLDAAERGILAAFVSRAIRDGCVSEVALRHACGSLDDELAPAFGNDLAQRPSADVKPWRSALAAPDRDDTDLSAPLRDALDELGIVVDDDAAAWWHYLETSESAASPALADAEDVFAVMAAWSAEPDGDALRVFRVEAARRPTLSRDEELLLARTFQSARQRAADLIADCPAALDEVCRVAIAVTAGQLGDTLLCSADLAPASRVVTGRERAANARQARLEGVRALRDAIVARDKPKIVKLLKTLEPSWEFVASLPAVVKQRSEQPRLDEALVRVIADGRAARRKMVEANLRLVAWLARRFANRGVAFADLLQEGTIGLMKAIDRFDHRLGNKFATYAVWWIRQAMHRAVQNHSQQVRVPVHVLEDFTIVARARAVLEQNMQHPSAEDIASEVNRWATDDRQTSSPERRSSSTQRITAARVAAVLRAMATYTSLDVANDDELLLSSDAVTAPNPEEIVAEAGLTKLIAEMLDELKPREAEVLRLRFGIGDGVERTLEEIGRCSDVTRERIRQIEVKALDALRRPSRLRRLSAFWPGADTSAYSVHPSCRAPAADDDAAGEADD